MRYVFSRSNLHHPPDARCAPADPRIHSPHPLHLFFLTLADNSKDFRHGLIAGDKEIIYHILNWLLPKMGALKTRAYLARFLVKLDVPGDIMQNDEVSVTYEKVRERGVWGRACVRAADLTRGNKRRSP